MRLLGESLMACVARLFAIDILPELPEDCQSLGWFRATARGCACNPDLRQVFLGTPDDPCDTQIGFHELIHCIVQPPGFSITNVNECLWLLQFEEAVAQAVARPRELEKILSWQLDLTPVRLIGRFPPLTLHQMPNYRELPFYLRGVENLETMGALKDGKPTWRYPDWSRIDHYTILRCLGIYPKHLS